jgi:hypothetical protein
MYGSATPLAPILVVTLENGVVKDGFAAPPEPDIVHDPSTIKIAVLNFEREIVHYQDRH